MAAGSSQQLLQQTPDASFEYSLGVRLDRDLIIVGSARPATSTP
jgi:hypothetical protein